MLIAFLFVIFSMLLNSKFLKQKVNGHFLLSTDQCKPMTVNPKSYKNQMQEHAHTRRRYQKHEIESTNQNKQKRAN